MQETLGSACISAVNLSEVIAKLADYGQPVEEIAYHIGPARVAASLREVTRAAGLSLGNRACLALALNKGLPALTTERSWPDCKMGVKVEVMKYVNRLESKAAALQGRDCGHC